MPLDDDIRARIVGLQESWASRGQRVLLLARKVLKAGGEDIPTGMGFDHARFGDVIMDVAKKDLTVVGMVGIVVRYDVLNQLTHRIPHVKTFLTLFVSVGLQVSDSSWLQGMYYL